MRIDERLKQLMKELGNAINESLSESERIAEAIANIKAQGYDVFLVLEATIGFNKREEEGTATEVPAHRGEGEGRLKFTSQDENFLRALKIAVEDNE